MFYEDLFYVGQWLHGELPGDSHPDFKSRIERLLEQSTSPDYLFDTEEGNAILATYWEISDLFREEFLLKLKNGKLETIKRKGEDTIMSGKGYEDAYAFDKSMCEVVRQIAQKEKVDKGGDADLFSVQKKKSTASRSIFRTIYTKPKLGPLILFQTPWAKT